MTPAVCFSANKQNQNVYTAVHRRREMESSVLRSLGIDVINTLCVFFSLCASEVEVDGMELNKNRNKSKIKITHQAINARN